MTVEVEALNNKCVPAGLSERERERGVGGGGGDYSRFKM